MSRRSRLVVAIALLVAVGLGTSGCSAETIGVIAVGVDDDGTYVAHLRVCEDTTVEHLEVRDDDKTTILELDTGNGLSDGATVPLVNADGRPFAVSDLQGQVFVAGRHSSSKVMAGANGSVEEWQALVPGYVLPSASEDGRSVTVREWADSACEAG